MRSKIKQDSISSADRMLLLQSVVSARRVFRGNVADVLKWKLPRMYIITNEPHTMSTRCDDDVRPKEVKYNL